MYQETREVVTIDEWTDRIYQGTPQEIMITNVVSGRKMKIQKYNLSDTGECTTVRDFRVRGFLYSLAEVRVLMCSLGLVWRS